jgi:hypothetical protein
MTENSQRLTAKIYQFPIGGRAANAVRRDTLRTAVELPPEAVSRVSIGGSWYHEEAVREADTSRKH